MANTTTPDTSPDATPTPETPQAAVRPQEAPAAPRSANAPHSTPEAATGPVQPREDAQMDHTEAADRPWTPDRANADGSTTIVLKRACNGCGTRLGDVTDAEMARGLHGLPLPDVRRECPKCGPTAPEPRCIPMPIVAGDPLCLEVECDHDLEDGAEYCVAVSEETVCGTHSELSNLGEVLHAQPWPCTHTKKEITR